MIIKLTRGLSAMLDEPDSEGRVKLGQTFVSDGSLISSIYESEKCPGVWLWLKLDNLQLVWINIGSVWRVERVNIEFYNLRQVTAAFSVFTEDPKQATGHSTLMRALSAGSLLIAIDAFVLVGKYPYYSRAYLSLDRLQIVWSYIDVIATYTKAVKTA